jgi:hypothetical protein
MSLAFSATNKDEAGLGTYQKGRAPVMRLETAALSEFSFKVFRTAVP